MKKSRRIDGKPETAADTRFFDLRESDFDGWIDQDGYAVACPVCERPGCTRRLGEHTTDKKGEWK